MRAKPKVFVYSKRAHVYENLMKLHRYEVTLHDFIVSLKLELPSQEPCILDLGCGTGIATQAIKEKFPKASLTAFDYSSEMLKIYKDRNPDVQIIQGDYNNELSFRSFPSREHISLDSNRFDLVISATSISEYGIPSKIFSFVNRILKKDGLFLIVGIKNNIIGYISNMIWDFKRLGEEDLISQFQKSNYIGIKNHKISWKFFPMNLMKFTISARKP